MNEDHTGSSNQAEQASSVRATQECYSLRAELDTALSLLGEAREAALEIVALIDYAGAVGKWMHPEPVRDAAAALLAKIDAARKLKGIGPIL